MFSFHCVFKCLSRKQDCLVLWNHVSQDGTHCFSSTAWMWAEVLKPISFINFIFNHFYLIHMSSFHMIHDAALMSQEICPKGLSIQVCADVVIMCWLCSTKHVFIFVLFCNDSSWWVFVWSRKVFFIRRVSNICFPLKSENKKVTPEFSIFHASFWSFSINKIKEWNLN